MAIKNSAKMMSTFHCGDGVKDFVLIEMKITGEIHYDSEWIMSSLLY